MKVNTHGYEGITAGRACHFEITVGLHPGYGSDGWNHSINDVREAHGDWQRDSKIIQGVLITSTTIAWGAPVDGTIEQAHEPGVVISGTINLIYDREIANAERESDLWYAGKGVIVSLATFIGSRLSQYRVYVEYDGWMMIFDNAEFARKE